MANLYTFDDVLIKPSFSYIKSRKDVDTSSKLLGIKLPVVSANMDTVTGVQMAVTMSNAGGMGCLHRFWDIGTNVEAFQAASTTKGKPMVSIGLGDNEFERANALISAGAEVVCIDVAHGAQIAVVEQLNKLYQKHGSNVGIIVGNFASIDSINQFKSLSLTEPMAFKVGIGPGSACTTRVKTGVGVPQLSAIIECYDQGRNAVIADGGLKTPGDIAKALAAGADAVMIGGMLAGTEETPGDVINHAGKLVKKYRGSASKESYEAQGKSEDWRTAEGESFLVPVKGFAKTVLQDIDGGLRSSMTYVGATTLDEFKAKAKFVTITGTALRENGAHGKV